MKRSTLTAVGLALAALSASSFADGSSSFALSGFGTLGIVKTDSDLGEFVTPGQVTGATKSAKLGVDSKLGVQATARLNGTLSGTVQVVSKYNGEGNYDPDVEWAFVKIQALSSLSLRGGRMGLPAFAVSDFRDVNFASLWIRPPIDVYGVLPMSHFDGLDVIHTAGFDGVNLTTQVFGGKADAKYQRASVKIDKLIGFNSTAEFDNGFTLRIGHFQSDIGVQIPGQPDPGDRNKRTAFSGVGLSYDKNNLVFNSEYVWGKRRDGDNAISPTGWYASLGYRVGKFTPYLVSSRFDLDIDIALPGGARMGLAVGQKTNAVGVRWDVMKNTAIKLQLDHVDGVGGGGQFMNPQPALTGKSVNAIGASVDFVF
jgi:hypothetical protein